MSRLVMCLSIDQRLVKCPEIKAKYGFRGRVASGWSEVDYNDEVARHALTTFLNLVLFLDRAKVCVCVCASFLFFFRVLGA